MPKRVSLDINELLTIQSSLTHEIIKTESIHIIDKCYEKEKDELIADLKKLRNKITHAITNYWR